MWWRRAKLAKYINISQNGVKYLEKMGLIRRKEDKETGCRYYNEIAFITLATAQSYKRMGFSLKEQMRMLKVSPDEMKTMLIRQRQRLEEDYRRAVYNVEIAGARIERVLAHENRISVTECPELYWIYDEDDPTDRIQEWILRMPLTAHGTVYTRENGRPRFDRCITMEGDLARQLGVDRDPTVYHIPVQTALYTVIRQSSNAEDVTRLEPLYDYARQNGYVQTGDAFARVLFSQNEVTDVYSYTEIWMPVADASCI